MKSRVSSQKLLEVQSKTALQQLSIKEKNLCLSVSLCVCVCVCVPQISLQIRIRLTWEFQHGCCWFKGVQHHICLDCNETVSKLLHKCFTNSPALSTGAAIATCAPEPVTAELKPTSRFIPVVCELDQDFAGGSVLFCASKLTVVD